MRQFFGLALVSVFIASCSHPLGIIGEGDISERLNGIRGCTYEEYLASDPKCSQNIVFNSDYIVSYEATPRPGWSFVEWQGLACGANSTPPYCEFNIPQSAVDQVSQWPPTVVPPTIAVFERDEPAVGEFRVNTLFSDLGFIDGTLLKDGNFVFCWDGLRVGQTDYEIICRIFGDDGSPKTSEIVVNEPSAIFDYPEDPRVVTLEDGTFIVVWNEEGEAVLARKFLPDGTPMSEIVQVNSLPGFSSYLGGVAALEDGGFIVSLDQYSDAIDGVYARRFGSNMVPSGPEFKISAGDGQEIVNDLNSDIVGLPDSGYYVAWSRLTVTNIEVLAQEYDGTDTAVGSKITIHQNLNLSNAEVATNLGKLSGSGVVVTWSSIESQADWDVSARFMPTGELASTQVFSVHEEDVGSEYSDRPAALLSNDSVIVTWDFEDEWGSTSTDSHSRFFSVDGVPLGPSFKVNEGDNIETYSTTAIPLQGGGAVVAWVEFNGDIWARRILDTDSDGYPDHEDPDPLDPGVPENCGLLPENVSLIDPVDWASPTPPFVVELGVSNIVSQPFVSTGNPNYKGIVAGAALPGTGAVSWQAWFSQCPGGPPLQEGALEPCKAQGTANTVLRWSQGAAEPWECKLETATQYFINFQNLTCDDLGLTQCDKWIDYQTNGQP